MGGVYNCVYAERGGKRGEERYCMHMTRTIFNWYSIVYRSRERWSESDDSELGNRVGIGLF